jgi:hypothetical protein
VGDHARPNALGSDPHPGEADAQDQECGKGDEESVREPERERGPDDRADRPEEAQDPHAEAAEEELLGERRQRDEDDRVEEEGVCPLRPPLVGAQALLLSRVQERLERGRQDHREDHDADGDPEPAPGVRPQAERFGPITVGRRDPEGDPDQDSVSDEAPDREVVLVQRLRVGTLEGLGPEGEADLDRDDDEPG